MPVKSHNFARLFASSDVNVDLDLSFAAQFVIFTALIVMLKPLIFDPLIRVWEERERRTDGAKEEAREMDAKAAELISRYEEELEKVRREAARERDLLRAESAKLEAKILAEAREESARILAEGKARIEHEVAALRRDLDHARPALAREIAAKILGREVQS